METKRQNRKLSAKWSFATIADLPLRKIEVSKEGATEIISQDPFLKGQDQIESITFRHVNNKRKNLERSFTAIVQYQHNKLARKQGLMSVIFPFGRQALEFDWK